MLKVNKKVASPVRFDSLRTGDTFTYDGGVYLMVNFDGRLHPVNLERANWATNIHADSKVMKCDCELTVLG